MFLGCERREVVTTTSKDAVKAKFQAAVIGPVVQIEREFYLHDIFK